MKNLKKSSAFALIVICLLVCFGLVNEVIHIVSLLGDEKLTAGVLVNSILSVILYLSVIFYAVYGYKIPHGNVLKWIFIFYALALSYSAIGFDGGINIITNLCVIFSAVSVAYVAGRLDRYKQNKVIAIVICVLLLGYTIFAILNASGIVQPAGNVGEFNPTVIPTGIIPIVTAEEPKSAITFMSACSYLSFLLQWLALGAAYLVRYHLHKEVGLVDKKTE